LTLQYGELRPTSSRDRFVSLGRPSKFQRVSRLGFVTATTSLNGSQPNFARCLAVSCAATLYIHFWRLLPRNGILPGAKFSLRPPSLALCYWQHYCKCKALEQWARAKLCGVQHRAPPIFGRATITLGIGPHSSYLCKVTKIEVREGTSQLFCSVNSVVHASSYQKLVYSGAHSVGWRR